MDGMRRARGTSAALDHVGLSVGDLDAALAWYAHALGWGTASPFEIPPLGLRGAFVTSDDGQAIELLERRGSGGGIRAADPQQALLTRGYGHVCLRVDDTDAWHARLLAAGATERLPPGGAPEPGVRFSFVADPEGNLIELLDRAHPVGRDQHRGGGTSVTVSTTVIPGFSGTVIDAAHPDYDDARRVWNSMHDRRPALVARCATREDVAAVIAHARRTGLEIAVRGGGHSLPGHSSTDGGVVIDLSGLRSVHVDPERRRAVVGGGALLGDVDTAAQQHGLVVPAGVISHTGVGGLTLGGGVGRLMRRFGLTVDSLLAAEVVTADGSVVRADADTNPDLFWGLRGGGGNFGVVTAFEFALHPLHDLVVLSCFHPLDRAHEVLGLAQATMTDAPEELLWTSFVRKGPSRPWLSPDLEGVPGVMSVVEWSGDPVEGRALLEELDRRLDPPTGSVDDVPYLVMQRAGDEEFGYGLYTYVKATFAAELSPGLVDVLVERGRLLGSPLTQVELLSMGGRIRAVAEDATAFPYRDAAWLLNVPASWTDPSDTEAERTWVRETHAAVEAFTTGGAYSNFIGDDEPDGGGDAYGATLDRLRRVKTDWDPENVFHRNQNVLPLPQEAR